MLTKLLVSVGLLGIAFVGSTEAITPVPQGPPVWCFGANEFDQCVLYLGTKETCQNLAPCFGTLVGLPTPGGLTFCLGADDVTGECKLFAGTETQCQSLEPCRAIPGQLPRAPKLKAPR